MIEGTVEQIVKVTAPKISIFYRIILVIACQLERKMRKEMGRRMGKGRKKWKREREREREKDKIEERK